MNKILNNFEAASKGEYAPSKQENNEMKTILESLANVAGNNKKPVQEAASVVVGDSADEVAQLARLMNNAGAPAEPVGAQPTTMHEPTDIADMPPMTAPQPLDDPEIISKPVAEDDWDNAPEETYDDHEKLTHDLSGGINRRKKSYKRAEPGDNPITAESSLKEELSRILKKKMTEKKTKPKSKKKYKKYTVEARKDSNFNLSDIEKLNNMDLETAKQHASTMMQNAKTMRPEKVQHFLRQIENAPNVAEIIFIMWNQYLAGTGDAVIGSRHSTKKSNYRHHFEDTDIEESPLDYKSFKEGGELQELRDAIESNKIVSVAFVKKDGTVRQMAIKKNLSAYVPSTAAKTDRQANVQQNNDIYKVVDINAYNKRLRELKQEGMDPEQAQAEAAKRAWRSIKLPNVLGFSVGGQFIDLRDENDIMDRFGEEVYNSLTPTMQKSINDNQKTSESMFAEATQKPRNFVAKHAQRSGAGAHKSKKDKTGRKAKHKAKEIQYESAPVFNRYVKPFLNKTPRKIVEFYDKEARSIIKRLGEERVRLQKANAVTSVHDTVLAQLRENLDVAPVLKKK